MLPHAFLHAELFVLPDGKGMFAIMPEADIVACPGCKRAAAFLVLRQHLDLRAQPASTWTYACVPCDTETP